MNNAYIRFLLKEFFGSNIFPTFAPTRERICPKIQIEFPKIFEKNEEFLPGLQKSMNYPWKMSENIWKLMSHVLTPSVDPFQVKEVLAYHVQTKVASALYLYGNGKKFMVKQINARRFQHGRASC